MLARAIPSSTFARRRRTLMERMGPGSVALLPAAPPAPRNRDVHYPYRQDSDFYYLTGFPEPEALAVLIPGGEQEFLLLIHIGNRDGNDFVAALAFVIRATIRSMVRAFHSPVQQCQSTISWRFG